MDGQKFVDWLAALWMDFFLQAGHEQDYFLSLSSLPAVVGSCLILDGCGLLPSLGSLGTM